MIFEHEKVEDLIAQRRLSEAAEVLALTRGDRLVRTAVFALAADDRGFVGVADPQTFEATSAYGHLVAATAMAPSSDASGIYDALRAAYDRALSERLFFLAVAARERLAYHALLFGDVELARSSIDEAIALASAHRFRNWLLHCLAVAARLALDAGDVERSRELLERARAQLCDAQSLALFAPTGTQLAIERGDDAELQRWISPAMLDVALHCEETQAAVAATIAIVIAAPTQVEGAAAIALRRALILVGNAANAPELFSTASRYGALDDARFSVHALAAVFGSNRPYLKAHHLLARAYFLIRSGEAADWIACAGDAARAFSAMGLRRWTNEAMLLLVAQQPTADRKTQGRPSGSALTEREQQVANLIRRGARNREVAEALQISEHTVERHVSSILGRLGLRSRWQIADTKTDNKD
jgi:DNA-binding CsgD family transcriptional regulator